MTSWRTSWLLALGVALSLSGTAAAEPDEADAKRILSSVDALSPRLSSVAKDVWSYAEVGFKETRSAARLQKELKDAGFKIETGVAGMPTAFVATAGSGGPVIALLAEYDALPGLSQTTDPARQSAGAAAGHACGHNLLGAASVTAAIALKQWLEQTGVKGTVRVYGSPAEEGGFAKVYFVRDGLFKDVDAVLSWHPGGFNRASQDQMLSMVTAKFAFAGTPSHAAAAPDRGRSALDGVQLQNIAVEFLREHVPQETRIHYTITDGGDQPNIVPSTAQNFYYVRHYDPAVVQDVWKRVQQAADGAALATGTKVSMEIIGGSYSTLPNDTLGRVVDASLRRVGGYSFTADEAAYAKALAASLPGGSGDPGDPSKIGTYEVGRKTSASSDVGDISWVVPTASLSIASWPAGTPPHTWQAASASGSSIGVKGAIVAAKTMALSATELFRRPEVVARAKEELQASRGAGFAYKALLGDRAPALDYTDRP